MQPGLRLLLGKGFVIHPSNDFCRVCRRLGVFERREGDVALGYPICEDPLLALLVSGIVVDRFINPVILALKA